jgi:hypothetical protein
MDTLYQAYQAYERRVMRGEFFGPAYQPRKSSARQDPLQAQLGGLLIHILRRLKVRSARAGLLTASSAHGCR